MLIYTNFHPYLIKNKTFDTSRKTSSIKFVMQGRIKDLELEEAAVVGRGSGGRLEVQDKALVEGPGGETPESSWILRDFVGSDFRNISSRDYNLEMIKSRMLVDLRPAVNLSKASALQTSFYL